MILTEEEAQKRWCPFSRMMLGDNGAYNRDWRDINSTNCIASQCMAWRWELITEFASDETQPIKIVSRKTGNGFCGLAGEPK